MRFPNKSIKQNSVKMFASQLHPFGRLGASLFMGAFLLLSVAGNANADQASGFAIRALHLSFRPQYNTPAFYRGVIDQASKLGYNTLILNTGGIQVASYTVPSPGKVRFYKWSGKQVTALLDYAKKAGLEPIFEVKIIAKHKALLKQLAKKHPGLLLLGKRRWSNGILNPAYRFPDGKDAYDAIELPMLDNFIALHGKTKPRYMLLGVDEVLVDQLDIAAKALNIPIDKLFAKLFNRCTQHLLDQGITPLFWGDMFLSAKLGKPGHGILGFKYDPRIKGGNASYLSQQANPPSVFTAMNDIQNRDKLIVADWHYRAPSSGEYPSVDYFQAMGFKDVWGATWYDDKGIRMFSRYAAKRKCGGMIATTWHTSISPIVRHLFTPLLNNSAVYFRNPNFEPPRITLTYRLAPTQKAKLFEAATERQAGVFLGSELSLSYRAKLPQNQQPGGTEGKLPGETSRGASGGAGLWISHDQRRKEAPLVMPLTFDPKSHTLTGSITLPKGKGPMPHTYSTALRWTERESGYMHQVYRPAHFSVTPQAPARTGAAEASAWFSADFSGLSADAFQSGLIYTAGRFPLLLQVEKPVVKVEPVEGVLNCLEHVAWGSNPKELWDRIATQGMQLDLTFKRTGTFKRKDYCAVMSFGYYSEGFRLLMAKDHTLLLQFAAQNGTAPIWITSPVKLPLDQWITVRVTLTPKTADKLRMVTFFVDNHKPVVTTLPRQVGPRNNAPIGLGIELRPHQAKAKTWLNFPGLIQKISIKPYTKSH